MKKAKGRGVILRGVRNHLEMTQAQMARGMGVNIATITAWETGKAPVPDGRLDTLLVMLLDVDRMRTLKDEDVLAEAKLIQAIREARCRPR